MLTRRTGSIDTVTRTSGWLYRTIGADTPNMQQHGRGREATMTTTVAESALNAADRCDRCGAQAYVRVTLASGFELLFCAHHSKEHADKLKQVALRIHDETEKIT
jgi:hypothetical protein